MVAIVTGIRARLEALLAPPTMRLRPFVVDDQAIGWIDDERARRLAQFSRVFTARSDGVHFAHGVDSHAARTEAMDGVVRTLSGEGALSAWRDERYAVVREFGDPAFFDLERCAARYFGVRTFAAHVNGLVEVDGDISVWFSRRSPAKAIDPGMLDNLVGGGIAAGMSVAATVVKEAWEEAGIPPSIAERARRVAEIRICRSHPLGIERETVYAHDLVLPADFSPTNIDGEAVEFVLADPAYAQVLISHASGPDVVTADATLVVVDWLLRCGEFAPSSDHAVALRAHCEASLELEAG